MDQPVLADRQRDPTVVTHVTALAAQVLTRYGADVTAARRAGGWSNFTWLAGGLAVQLRQLEERTVLRPEQSAGLLAILDRFWAALPGAAVRLNHGDLTTENALWHQGRVASLLDFEFAVLAPVELDTNELLGLAYAPPEMDDPLPDPTGAGLRRLQEAAFRAVLPVLERPGASDRLHGYAVLLQVWAMHKWLVNWDGRQDYTAWRPYQMLTAMAAGDGGYLAPVLALLT